ncbi:MAG: hypothetical protein HYY93_12410 [Planctomycetes bacterium]|nr:hypothetical protein [Planctomycetota bacterium]
MPIEFKCGKCGKGLKVPDTLGGRKVRCPSCTTVQNVPPAGPTGAGAPLEPRAAWAPRMAAPAPPAGGPSGLTLELDRPPGPGQLPVTMVANKVVAGRMCPACAQKVALGAPVHNCQACGSTHHEACWADRGRCAVEGCSASAGPAPAPGRTEISGPSKPCIYCGEPIHASAKKCRHCGEWLDPAMKRAEESGEALTPAEWVFAILCGNIACIVAIIWMIQGNPKGKKLFLVTLVTQVVAFFIGMIMGAVGGRR